LVVPPKAEASVDNRSMVVAVVFVLVVHIGMVDNRRLAGSPIPSLPIASISFFLATP